jgi:hypothetical protein
MIKREVEDWSVDRLDKERESISFPEYQREKALWTDEKKGLLIDSILRDIDIPKLYFNRLKDKTIEVIDGQQRLWSVWQFLDNEYSYKFDDKPLFYSDLSRAQKEKVRNYEFQITVFREADDEYLRDLFLRLQFGLLLNTGEKLHAATGRMKEFVFGQFVQAPFIENLGTPKRRYAKQTLCAQIAINIFSRLKLSSFARTRYDDLLHFFSEYERPQGKDLAIFEKATKDGLRVGDRLGKIFGKDAKRLRSRSYILSIFLFFDELVEKDGDLSAKSQKEFGEFVFRLMKRLREESRLGIDRKNRELYSFDTLLSSAPSEKYQIERRHEKLQEYYTYFKKTAKIKGDR